MSVRISGGVLYVKKIYGNYIIIFNGGFVLSDGYGR